MNELLFKRILNLSGLNESQEGLELKYALMHSVQPPTFTTPEGMQPIDKFHVTLIGGKVLKPYVGEIQSAIDNFVELFPKPKYGRITTATRPNGKSSYVAEIVNQKDFKDYVDMIWAKAGLENKEPERFFHVTLANNAGGVGRESIGNIVESDFLNS
jgi:hypothetical protein